jgi:hypothetical protein
MLANAGEIFHDISRTQPFRCLRISYHRASYHRAGSEEVFRDISHDAVNRRLLLALVVRAVAAQKTE